MLITDKTELRQFAACHRVWQGIPGIARTKKGRTFLSFYSGNTTETYGNYAAVIQSNTDNDFTEPIAVAKKSGHYRCFDPVLWIDPLGRLWFIWNVAPGEEVFGAICEDPDTAVLHWSKPFYIGRGVMMNKPVVLSSGEWLFPIAFWNTSLHYEIRKDGLREVDIPGSYVYKTVDNGKTFTRLGYADVRNRSFDEHMVVEQENGVLMMLVRARYGIGAAYSYDRGKTWSAGEDSGLGGPSSRFFLGKLRSGRVLLINHYQYTGRNNLTAMLSEDDGKTFPYQLLLDPRSNVSYPDAMEGDDGFIYIVYDRERGSAKTTLLEVYADARELLTARITEQDILNGTISTEGSFLQNVACKLSTLSPEDPDPFQKALKDRELAELLISSGTKDIINEVFARYPVKCTDLHLFRREKLDAQIQKFQETGETDVELLTRIINLLRHAGTDKPEWNPVVDAVTACISQNLAEDLTIAAIADRLQTSRYYLSHLFKAKTGISISEYRNELRLTEAKKLLVHSVASISEIAQQTGFCSASYFSEVFQKRETISPSDYRKIHSVKAHTGNAQP